VWEGKGKDEEVLEASTRRWKVSERLVFHRVVRDSLLEGIIVALEAIRADLSKFRFESDEILSRRLRTL